MKAWPSKGLSKTALLILIITITILVALLFVPTCKTEVTFGSQPPLYYRLPFFIKLAAFCEREYVYRFYVNDIIAPGIANREEKVVKIFQWINEHIVDIPTNIQDPIERHELDFIIRQYGNYLHRIRLFRNLIEFINCPSRAIHTDLRYNGRLSGSWVVVTTVAGRDLYFDIANRLFLVTQDGKVASLLDIKNHPELLSIPHEKQIEIDHQIFDESARDLTLKDIDQSERPSMQKFWLRTKNLLMSGH